MKIEDLLQEEITSEFSELKQMTVGSDDYKATVDGVTKLVDRLISIRKLNSEQKENEYKRNAEMEIKREQMENDATIKREQIETEVSIKREQFEMESTIKREQMEKEMEIKREQIETEVSIKREQMDGEKIIVREQMANDLSFKREQLEEDKKDRRVKDYIAIAGIVIPSVITIWGALKSWEFEKEGIVTTTIGRGFMGKLLPKK